jgi:hypothetical protein
VRRFDLTWDKDYGSGKRTGWTVTLDGVHLVQLEPWLVVALLRAVRTWFRWKRSGWDGV